MCDAIVTAAESTYIMSTVESSRHMYTPDGIKQFTISNRGGKDVFEVPGKIGFKRALMCPHPCVCPPGFLLYILVIILVLQPRIC